MYIAATIKRYRAVKEVGEIKMSVGITAYYQAKQICQAEYFRQRPKSITTAKLLITDKHPMHSDWYFRSKEAMAPLTNQVDNTCMHNPGASTFAAVQPQAAKHLMPVHEIEFQSSEICPKNFIIFDQAGHRSQVLYNPAVAHNHIGPSLNIHGTYIQENFARTYIQENFERTGTYNVEREISSSLKEDSDDIDALMSMEEEEQEDCDGEEKGSTSGSSSTNSERKRQKMKKMVKTLRGIVPGGDQMNTVTVLDEAVRYLKSLKVEVQKLGAGMAAHDLLNIPVIYLHSDDMVPHLGSGVRPLVEEQRRCRGLYSLYTDGSELESS
ncbi:TRANSCRIPTION FACTOR BHLH144 [Salix koriyanagi]|uniref:TRANSCRIPTION FACTOR BHLH144 n=1 Tax=Salix koriyanagi TaxID=2511006 RepID=A0A9Q0ZBC3_9ROSI|nr:TRANSCRIPTION FACTOR BHLH144 [Salix koriyanagi]